MIAKFCLNPALRPPRLWSVATRRQASDSASPNAEKVSASRLDRVAETRQVNTSRTRYGLFGLEPSLNHLIIKCLRIFTHRTLQTSNHLAFVQDQPFPKWKQFMPNQLPDDICRCVSPTCHVRDLCARFMDSSAGPYAPYADLTLSALYAGTAKP